MIHAFCTSNTTQDPSHSSSARGQSSIQPLMLIADLRVNGPNALRKADRMICMMQLAHPPHRQLDEVRAVVHRELDGWALLRQHSRHNIDA